MRGAGEVQGADSAEATAAQQMWTPQQVLQAQNMLDEVRTFATCVRLEALLLLNQIEHWLSEQCTPLLDFGAKPFVQWSACRNTISCDVSKRSVLFNVHVHL